MFAYGYTDEVTVDKMTYLAMAETGESSEVTPWV